MHSGQLFDGHPAIVSLSCLEFVLCNFYKQAFNLHGAGHTENERERRLFAGWSQETDCGQAKIFKVKEMARGLMLCDYMPGFMPEVGKIPRTL